MRNLIDQLSYELLKEFQNNPQNTFQNLNAIITNTATLTTRLKQLITLEVLEKRKRIYKLTTKGRKLIGLLDEASQLLKMPRKAPNPFERIPNTHIIELLEDYAFLLKKHFKEALLCVFLFGSCARGNWNEESDIDLLIIVKDWEIPSWEKSRELIEVKKKLRRRDSYKNLRRKRYYFPLSHYPLSDTECKRFHPVFYDIVLDGIILYEQNQFGTHLLKQYQKELEQQKAKRITKPNKTRYWRIEKGQGA
ncbi:MAG: nucleotidyltransferase domain-containing protein [Candidatus Heimdallarchaeota archaeon]|nr:MAG: nucleotidyltransferase domain-containing protein [Candidatus Heimdallarchaeota archaeon]